MRFDWLTDQAKIEETASFFQNNVNHDPSYISHSELNWGRALSPNDWSPDLLEVLKREFSERTGSSASANQYIACCTIDDELVGIALLDFHDNVPIHFGVLEDIVIAANRRSTGIGNEFMEWIIGKMKKHGMKRIFLESGFDNHSAHHWFAKYDFRQVSIVMMANIEAI